MSVRDSATWLLYLGSSGAGGDLESMGRRHMREDYGVGLCLGRGEAETALALGAERPGSAKWPKEQPHFISCQGSSLTFLRDLESLF